MKPTKSIRTEGFITRVATCLLFTLVSGCITNSEVIVSDVEMDEEANEGEMSVADLLAHGKFAEAELLARVCIKGGQHPFSYANEVVKTGGGAGLKKQYRNFAPSSDSDITMHRLNLSSVLLLEGKKDEAHRELLCAREELEQMFDPDSQALKLMHGEREKYFKGDGYERATMYAFLALSFMEKGNYVKALKCVQCGILADSDAEKLDYRADYALLPYIGYIAACRAGDNWRQEARKYDALVKEITGSAPSEKELPNAILVAWVGRGADRTLGGEFEEKRFVRKGSSRGCLDTVVVRANGMEYLSAPELADLNFQATTRGRRVMDYVLDSKTKAKRGLAASANVLLAVGASCIEAGLSSGQRDVAIVMCAVGGLCVGLGYPTHLFGMAINSRADDRCWQTLPGRLVVVPLLVPRQRVSLEILGYRRLDNVLRKVAEVDFGSTAKDGISVCHFSLLADRDGIESVIEDGLVKKTDAIAARTKDSNFDKKVELTTEDDK